MTPGFWLVPPGGEMAGPSLGAGNRKRVGQHYLRKAPWTFDVGWKSSFFFFNSKKFFFCLFRAASMAYGSSQDRGWIRAVAIGLRHSHSNAGSKPLSVTYTTAHGNARCLTHRARPGIEPASSWILVMSVTAEPWQELPPASYLILQILYKKRCSCICTLLLHLCKFYYARHARKRLYAAGYTKVFGFLWA